MFRIQTLPVLCLSVCCGCASFESQLVHRDACNSKWQHMEADGVPITVSVPTHIDVRVVQEAWLYKGKPFPSGNDQLVTTRVEHEVVYTDRIFTVDPKRPAAGTSKPSITMNGQYPDLIKSEVNDETIKEIGAAIARINGAGGFAAAFGISASEKNQPSPSPHNTDHLFRIDNVTAANRFDLDAPDLQLQIQSFLDQHVSCRPGTSH